MIVHRSYFLRNGVFAQSLKARIENRKRWKKFNRDTSYLPEISIPVVIIRNSPLSLSLAAAHRQDEFLFATAKKLL
jgi:Asp-tRNA(Asn)/Glu-tRNA(Gln) amidotransferase A subunit family amidase